MLHECEQLWASRAAQALDARLTNHVVAPSVNLALEIIQREFRSSPNPVLSSYYANVPKCTFPCVAGRTIIEPSS